MAHEEAKIKHEVKSYLEINGFYVFNITQKSKGYKIHSGISDLIAVKNGITIYVEIKTAKGKQRDSQKEFQRHIENHGAKYFVVRSIDDMEFILQEEGLL